MDWPYHQGRVRLHDVMHGLAEGDEVEEGQEELGSQTLQSGWRMGYNMCERGSGLAEVGEESYVKKCPTAYKDYRNDYTTMACRKSYLCVTEEEDS